PGRARGGGGPGGAAGVLGADLPAGRGGDHDRGHHPLHGRGGPLPEARLHVEGTAHRQRDSGGDPAAVRPAVGGGRVRGAAAPGRGDRGMMAALARMRDSSLWPMLRKEFRQMARDRFTVGMLVGLPSVQLLLFGYGIRTEVRHVPMVVVDQSVTQESRALATLLANTQNFDVASRAPGLREAEAELASG